MPVSVNHLLSLEWKTWAAKNNPPDAVPVSLFAFSDQVGTTNRTLWDGLPSAYAFPSSASTMGIASSLAADSGGIIAINGLDSDWNPVSENITLSTAPVFTVNSYYRINSFSMIVPAVGQIHNTGIITAKGGATTYAQINADIGSMQAGWYSVPSGCSLYIYAVDCYSGDAASNSKFTTFNVQVTNHNVARPMTFDLLQSAFLGTFNVTRIIPQVRTQKSDIEWQFKVSQGTQSVSLIVQGYLLTN